MVKPGKVASCFQRDALGNRALVLYDSTSQDKKHPCLTLVIKYLRPHHTIQLYPRVSAGGGWRGRETSVRRFEAMRKSHGCSRFDRRGAETEERVLAPPPSLELLSQKLSNNGIPALPHPHPGLLLCRAGDLEQTASSTSHPRHLQRRASADTHKRLAQHCRHVSPPQTTHLMLTHHNFT